MTSPERIAVNDTVNVWKYHRSTVLVDSDRTQLPAWSCSRTTRFTGWCHDARRAVASCIEAAYVVPWLESVTSPGQSSTDTRPASLDTSATQLPCGARGERT